MADPRHRLIPCHNRGPTTWMTLEFVDDGAIARPAAAPSRADYPMLIGDLCYFIGGEKGPVKIGHSIDPWTRRDSFQCGSPVELYVLAVCEGGVAAESAYHRLFAGVRLHGEWFKRSRAITAEIARLSGAAA